MTAGELLQAVLAGLSVGAVYGLAGMGFSLVWALTRVIQFAHGDVIVGAVLLAVFAVVGTTPVAVPPGVATSVLAVAATLAIGVGLSVGCYLVAVRPFIRGGGDSLGWVGATATVGLLLRASVALVLPAAAYAAPDVLHLDSLNDAKSLSLPGGGQLAIRVLPVLAIALASALVADRFLVRSRLGQAMRAVADDADAAALCGISVERVVVLAFAAAGLLAAVAALLIAPAAPLTADSGALLGLAGASAAYVGRLRSPRAAVIGGLCIGVAQQVVAVFPGLGASWSELVPAAALIVVLTWRPLGLIAPREAAAE
ncbi:MAG TPA: hypothetical protein VHD81_04095 [Mycobacteriales bacterium]|nr:hypothetical protein [Mycobacteriales bacterium]